LLLWLRGALPPTLGPLDDIERVLVPVSLIRGIRSRLAHGLPTLPQQFLDRKIATSLERAVNDSQVEPIPAINGLRVYLAAADYHDLIAICTSEVVLGKG